jgi:hypothetical protein
MIRTHRQRWWLAAAGLLVYLGTGVLVGAMPADDEEPPRAGAPVVGGPRLDHKAHMARGLKCLDCHQSVAMPQDPLAPEPAPVKMCQRCHDDIDQRLPEDQRVANVFFDKDGKPLRKRAVLPYTGDVIWNHAPHKGIECLTCHKDIVETNVRRAAVLMDMDTCMACHHDRGASNDCAACHSAIRSGTAPLSHDAAWNSTHGGTVKSMIAGNERDTCAFCHTKDSCATCHATKRPPSHGPAWLGDHGGLLYGAQRRNEETNCSFCHTPEACTTCHTQTRPPSHDPAWITGHGPRLHHAQDAGQPVNCMFCHQQEQCDTCHATAKPPSHDAQWLGGHATQLRAGGTPALERCVLCHQSGAWCDSCHTTKAPASHAHRWVEGHGNVVASGGRNELARCSFCHQDERWCDDCHKGKVPPSHDALWTLRHGDTFRHGGREGAQRCAFCHFDPAFCEDCHREQEPQDHTNLFRLKTHGLVASIDRARCQACHQSDFCVTCHEETPPLSHTAGWSGTQSRHCLGCHFPISREPSCRTCHLSNPAHDTAPGQPPSHGPGLNCRLCHNSVGGGGAPPLVHPDNGIACELCHRR